VETSPRLKTNHYVVEDSAFKDVAVEREGLFQGVQEGMDDAEMR
jgi:hypothetical protein